jgi:hypothetical protein
MVPPALGGLTGSEPTPDGDSDYAISLAAKLDNNCAAWLTQRMSRIHTKRLLKTKAATSNSPPVFSPQFLGRNRSIILDGDDASQNLLINKNLLKPHKKDAATPRAETAGQNEMSHHEFAWWSNPFCTHVGYHSSTVF